MKNIFRLSTFVALVGSVASAQTISCPGVARILFNGDTANMTYAPVMGFKDNQDLAYFVSTGSVDTEYRASKWGAYISIPNVLLDGRVAHAQVVFNLPEVAPIIVDCTAE